VLPRSFDLSSRIKLVLSTKLTYVGPGWYWDGWPCPGSIPGAGHLFRYVTNQPPKANSAFHPFGVGKWVPASAGKAKAGMVHSVSGCTRGVQVKLWDPLSTRAISERYRGVFTTRRCTNPRLPYLTLSWRRSVLFESIVAYIFWSSSGVNSIPVCRIAVRVVCRL